MWMIVNVILTGGSDTICDIERAIHVRIWGWGAQLHDDDKRMFTLTTNAGQLSSHRSELGRQWRDGPGDAEVYAQECKLPVGNNTWDTY